MILIEEKECLKLPGLTSLFISFSKVSPQIFHEILTVLKSRELYNFDKKTNKWELPITDLAFLLDNLTILDDININILNSKDKEVGEIIKPSLNYKTKPKDHQIEGIEYGLNHKNFLLLDEPGLGKTYQIINLARELKERNGIKHCVIICGFSGLKTNWEEEIKKHSDLDFFTIGRRVNRKGKRVDEGIPYRVEQLKQPINEFFIITTISSFRSDAFLNAFNKLKDIDMLVIDEIHKIKSKTTQQGRNLLKTKSNYKVGLTGTLIINNPLDTYVPLTWLDINKSNLTNFKAYFCLFDSFIRGEVTGYKNIPILKEMLDNNSIRRTKDIIKDLPPKTVINEYVDMNDDQSKLYEDVKNGIKEDITNITLNTDSLFSSIIRLRQVTSSPNIFNDKGIISSKIERAIDLGSQIVDNGNKIVIFTTFVETAETISKLFNELNYPNYLVTGKVDSEYFDKAKYNFQNKDEAKIFIGTYGKCSTGITLNAATYMICIDECWTDAENQQAQDRIHRVDNTSPVIIYNLICKDTIDEKVHQLSQTKKLISDYMIDGKVNPNMVKELQNIILEL